MFLICPNCGCSNHAYADRCSECGQKLVLPDKKTASAPDEDTKSRPEGPVLPDEENVSPSSRPPNRLVAAILATIFCCVPFGIVAIVYASRVDAAYAAGDYAGAIDASESATTWINASIIGFFVQIILGILFPLFSDFVIRL